MTAVFDFDNTYARDLDGLAVEQFPVAVPSPRLVQFNEGLAQRLGLYATDLSDEQLAELFAGNAVPDGAAPISQGYAGHQFGSYNPQLGDGRQVLLGEVVAPDHQRFDIALKGSGRTPFSRGGDGRASIGPVLREYLMGEAMSALGVPTTRALAAVTTGEQIARQRVEPGAILTRVASSHLRIGTFQWVAARGERADLVRLVDYALERHGPSPVDIDPADRAIELLIAVVDRQASLIARWMHLGFIHGVMNTDNMTISGETIDYGPCAFMDSFDPATVFSSIDHGGRYAYGNQPTIGLWNLARLAETLLPLIDDDTDAAVDAATEVLDSYQGIYDEEWVDLARVKLGAPGAERQLAVDFLALLQSTAADHTLAWRRLVDAAAGNREPLQRVIGDGDEARDWTQRWERVVDRSEPSIEMMRTTSPLYVPRNHLVEAALDAAVEGDHGPFERLLGVVTKPFDERLDDVTYAQPAPEGFTSGYRTFCGT